MSNSTLYSATSALPLLHLCLQLTPGHRGFVLTGLGDQDIVEVFPELSPLLKVNQDRFLFVRIINYKLNAFP
jgi:hypothetical protein